MSGGNKLFDGHLVSGVHRENGVREIALGACAETKSVKDVLAKMAVSGLFVPAAVEVVSGLRLAVAVGISARFELKTREHSNTEATHRHSKVRAVVAGLISRQPM